MIMQPTAGQAPAEGGIGAGLVSGSGKPERRKNRLLLANRLFRYLCVAAAGLVCLVLLAILFLMFRTGILTFVDITPAEFFLSADWAPESESYGALSINVGVLF